mgnify:CR=1 FL=1
MRATLGPPGGPAPHRSHAVMSVTAPLSSRSRRRARRATAESWVTTTRVSPSAEPASRRASSISILALSWRTGASATLYVGLLNHPDVVAGKVDFKSIKVCISGAAPLLLETKLRFESITGGRIVEGYSLTEAMMAGGAARSISVLSAITKNRIDILAGMRDAFAMGVFSRETLLS